MLLGALLGAFSQAFSVIVKTGCGTDGALHGTSPNIYPAADAEANAKVQRTTTSVSPGRSGAAAQQQPHDKYQRF